MAEQINETTYDITTVSGHISAVEVGDLLQDDFYPQIKVKAWDNEANFSVRLDTSISGATFEETASGIVWYSADGNVVGTFYYFTTEEIENGAYEFELDLYDKPSSRTIPFTIRSKELDFFYQPALTQEEIDNGDERPENVVGSYAVYHSSKSNNKYKAGKALHIFRPWAQDANGWKVWCELNIDVANQTLTITLPEDFYNDAVYPVKIDPTLGYTSVGGSVSALNLNEFFGCAWNTVCLATQNGSVDKFWISGKNAAGIDGKLCKTKPVITDVSGNILTNGIGPEITDITLRTVHWRSIDYIDKPNFVSGNYYMPGHVGWNGTGGVQYATSFDSVPVGQVGGVLDPTNNYNTPQNTGTLLNLRSRYTIYVEYSAAAPSGYTHTVNNIPAANLASLNGVATANIAKVNGV